MTAAGAGAAGVEGDRVLARDRALEFDPLLDPGVFTLAGDWHGAFDVAADVVARTPPGRHGVRLVLQVGDLGIWPGAGGASFLDDLEALLTALDAVVLFVDGNHDDHSQILGSPFRHDGLRVIRPRVYHLPRGFRWRWSGVSYLAIGGAHTIVRANRQPGVNWWPEELITAEQAEAAIRGGAADVMISHDCPAGVSIPGIRDPAPGQPRELYEELVREAEHRALVRGIVEAVAPHVLFHGHYHVRHDATLELARGGRCAITGLGGSSDAAANAVVVDGESLIRGG